MGAQVGTLVAKRVGACVVVVALLLAGCAGPAAPEATSGGVPSTAPSATSSTAPSGVPVVRAPPGDLMPGEHSFGILAKYERAGKLWDIQMRAGYLSPAAAAAALNGSYLGAGFGITPDDPAVRAVVGQVVHGGSSVDVALALYRWMLNNTDYDFSRLSASDLQIPAKTLQTHGGVCRDLAALYVSLLRAAGVPARLVTGYVGTTIGDFHAWVEFYAGPLYGQDPWMPVDVSIAGGSGTPEAVAFFFGVQRAEDLPLRTWTDADDDTNWAMVSSWEGTWNGAPPKVSMNTTLIIVSEHDGVLCISPATFGRIAYDDGQCTPGMEQLDRPFILETVRTLDYGFNVAAATGAKLNLTLAVPTVLPGETGVQSRVYAHSGPAWTEDHVAGVVRQASAWS